jgi:hypothetical protein
MSINIDDFITKTKDFTKPCYCVAVGTIGNIAKIGSITSHYYGLTFIHNKLFSYSGYFVNMLPYSSNISSYIKTFKIAKYSIDLLKHMHTFAPEFIPNALKLTGSLSGLLD